MTDEALTPLQDYLRRLKGHDWYYAYSDDGSVYRRGSAAASALSELRQKLDPDSTIWNSHAPEDYKIIPEEAREKGRALLAEIIRDDETDHEKVRQLVEDGAYIDSRDREKRTALSLAIAKKDVKTAQYLLSKGANTGLRDDNGMSAAMIACAVGATEIVSALVRENADITTAHYKGETPIVMAAREGYTDTVIVLLLAGVDPKAKNWNRPSAIETAQKAGHTALARIMEYSQEDLRKTAIDRGILRQNKIRTAFVAKVKKLKSEAQPPKKKAPAMKAKRRGPSNGQG